MPVSNRTSPKKLLLLILISIFFLLGLFSLKAQSLEKYDPTKQLTKAHINNNSYVNFTPQEIKWFSRQGFPTEGYHWDNQEVNLHLYKGKGLRDGSRIITGLGALTFGLGCLMYIGSEMHDDVSKNENTKNDAKNIFLASGIIFSGALVLKLTSIERINKAIKLRNKLTF